MGEDVDVIIERGDFRAVIERAAYQDPPEDDAGPIVLRRDYDERRGWYRYAVVSAPGATITVRGYGWDGRLLAVHIAERLTDAEWAAHDYGGRSESDAAETALLRAGAADWHTMTACGDRSATEYLAVTFEPDSSAKEWAAEWQAWLDGDVYDVAVQARSVGTVHPSAVFYVGAETFERWDDVQRIGGYYGREWAEQAARELFEETAAG